MIRDDSFPARGVLIALVLGLLMWAAIIAAVVWLVKHPEAGPAVALAVVVLVCGVVALGLRHTLGGRP